MSQQLVKKGTNGKYSNVMPKSWIEAIKDKNTGKTLVEILQSFNMYFLPYDGNSTSTRCLVPTMLRKKGLWITYVKYDGNIYTEWYASEKIDDNSWGNSSNWRVGNNTLVGDITISANGNWVINGTETEFKAVGEKGNTPLVRFGSNNKFQVSYSNGEKWVDISDSISNNLRIKKYIGINESLPTSGVEEGTIYMKGPYYAEDDTLNNNPIYRMWVYAWKDNILAWQDNGEYNSISAGIVQETGPNKKNVMSQRAVSNNFIKLESNIDSIKVTPIIYKFSERNGKVLRGDVVEVNEGPDTSGFATSDFISIPDDTYKIRYINTYDIQGDNYFAGIVLYNNAKNNIIYVGGHSGEVLMSDYPEAKYFRYCIESTTELSDCKIEIYGNKPFDTLSTLREDIETLNKNLFKSSSYKLNSRNGKVLRGDVVGVGGGDNTTEFSTSDFIEIEAGVKSINYQNTFAVQPNNYFAGFVLYNELKDTIIYIGGLSGSVSLLDYPEARYFRFCCDAATELDLCEVNVNYLNIGGTSDLIKSSEVTFINTVGENTDYIKSDRNHIYIGYNELFRTEGLLLEYRISLYDSSAYESNTEFEFIIGQIDQRNWLLPRLTLSKPISRIENGMLVFDFSNELISFKKNEVIFIKVNRLSSSNNIIPIHVGNKNILYTYNLYDALETYGNYEASIKVNIKNIDSYFAPQQKVDSIEEDVKKIDSIVNNKQNSILIDEVNGNKYKLVVNNGELSLKILRYSRVLFIGNSFTSHNYVAGLWESDGRSMAASTDDTMYTTLVANQMDLQVDRTGLVGFERNLSNFDFSDLPNKSISYDAIVVQLGENIIETNTDIIKNSFRNLFNAIKSNWSKADVYAMLGTWRTATSAISDVANEMSIPVINCSSNSLSVPYQQKDYYIGDSGSYYEMNDAVFTSHPSDIGMYNMAQEVIKSFGGNPITDKLFNITLNQTNGGTISTAYNKWVEGGVVTVRCNPNDGNSINNLVVESSGNIIPCVKRYGTYLTYTFIMPKDNVTITPSW